MTFAATPTHNVHHAKFNPRAFSEKQGQSTTTGSEAVLRYPNTHLQFDKIPSPTGIPMMYAPEMLAHMVMQPPMQAYQFETPYHCNDHVASVPMYAADPRFRMLPQDAHLQRPTSAAVNPKALPRAKTESRNNLSELKAKLLAATIRDIARKRMMRSWVELRANTSMSLVKDSMKEIVATMSISDYAERVKVLFVPDSYEHSSVASEVSSPTATCICDFDKDALPSVMYETKAGQTDYKQPKIEASTSLMKCHITRAVQPQTSLDSAMKMKGTNKHKNTHVVSKEPVSRASSLQMRMQNQNQNQRFKFDDIQETDSLVSGVTDTQSTYTPRYIVEQRRWEEAEAQRKQMPQ